MNKVIVECEQCGEVFITDFELTQGDIEIFGGHLEDDRWRHGVNFDSHAKIKHKCSQFNDELTNKISLSEVELYADCEIIGKCKVIGVVRTPK